MNLFNTRYNLFAVVCLLLCCFRATGDDNVKFKPRAYTPSKTLKSNTYDPKTYAPKQQALPKQFEGKKAENKIAESKTFTEPKSRSDKTTDATTPFTGMDIGKAPLTESKAYLPGESDFPSTISVDKSLASQAKKAFLVSSNNSPFVVTERPKERNPLLEPRQGIKAPVETTPTKDQTK